jgi:hypothetical protein
MKPRTVHVLFGSLLASLVACGGRPDGFDAPLVKPDSFALEGQVALVDAGADRVVLLTPREG